MPEYIARVTKTQKTNRALKKECPWKPGDWVRSTLDKSIFGEIEKIDEKGRGVALKGRKGKYSPDSFEKMEKP